MHTQRRIRAVVVSVPVDNDWLASDRLASGSVASRARFKPSDLVPWSDPYIAGLIRKLQDEVRQESQAPVAEAEMPWNEPFEYEFEPEGEGSFSIDTTALLDR